MVAGLSFFAVFPVISLINWIFYLTIGLVFVSFFDRRRLVFFNCSTFLIVFPISVLELKLLVNSNSDKANLFSALSFDCYKKLPYRNCL